MYCPCCNAVAFCLRRMTASQSWLFVGVLTRSCSCHLHCLSRSAELESRPAHFLDGLLSCGHGIRRALTAAFNELMTLAVTVMRRCLPTLRSAVTRDLVLAALQVLAAPFKPDSFAVLTDADVFPLFTVMATTSNGWLLVSESLAMVAAAL